MKTEIDIQNWVRKDHYEFFSKFDEPFFGITTKINCTKAYEVTRNNDMSFFLYYLHNSLVAANRITAFKYRINDGKVYEYDVINASPTINRANGTFGFSYIEYKSNFKEFTSLAKPIIKKAKNSSGLDPATSGENVIHFSSIPWIDFTSISHARNFSFQDSCPKITFGKMTEIQNQKFMPVSVHVHHALVDGFDVGQFFDEFQKLLN
jgi:chloramphenicol O-acetyltransferase type A